LFRLYPHDIIEKIRLLEAVMQQVAQGLASLGRGNDKMLVHMTPREVAGLQSLALAHGGSLTTNPHTGLPEAGFLDNLLPTLIGVGLTAATGLPAWQIGLGVGGATALASGNLSKGLMAGLGAFGGAGLGGALGEFGNVAGVEAAKQKAIQDTMTTAAANAAAEGMQLPAWYENTLARTTAAPLSAPLAADATMADRLGAMGRGIEGAATNPAAFGANVTDKLGGKYGVMAAAAPTIMAGMQALAKPQTLTGATSAADKGTIRPYGYTPGRVNPNFGKPGEPYFLDQGFTAYPTYKAAAGGQVPNPNEFYPGANIPRSTYAMSTQAPMPQSVVGDYDAPINPFTGETNVGASAPRYMADGGLANTEIYSNDDATTQLANSVKNMSESQLSILSEEADSAPMQAAATKELELRRVRQRTPKSAYTKMAGGGIAGFSMGGISSPLQTLIMQMEKQGAFGDPRDEAMKYAYNPDDQQYTQMAAGGIASLPEYAAGGKLLRGPGDGMSDDIPAVIKGQKPQRAALADGEFVIPADVVSHLGNGSTDAGAKRLYSMMDKVRTARTGRKAQGRQINAERYMPA
jgi:hypothetical protein